MPNTNATKNFAVCLWFDGQAEEAANFYARTFPDSHVDARRPACRPGSRWSSPWPVCRSSA